MRETNVQFSQLWTISGAATQRQADETQGFFFPVIAVLLSLAMMHSTVFAAKTVLYVAVNGNDQWSGRYADPQGNDGPLATLDGARRKVRELIKAQQTPASEVTDGVDVLIRGGTYELRETVVFGPDDSGRPGAPVSYKAFPGENPVFSAGVAISQWTKCDRDPEGTAVAAQGKLWFADVPSMPNGKWVIKSLYDRDRLLQRSTSGELFYADRKRDNDYNMQGKKIYRALDYEGEPVAPFDRDITYRGDDMRSWKNTGDIEIVLRERRWIYNLIPLDRIDEKTKTAWMAVDPTYQPTKPTKPYWIENAIDYLDEPGEWVFDRSEGRLNLWPDRDVKEMEIIAPYLQELIRVEGQEDGPFTKNLRFEGLTFRHGLRDTLVEGDRGLQHDWEMYDKGNAAIRFRHAEDCVVSRCEISHSSGTGIRLDLHCQKITLSSSRLSHLGGNGIVLSGYGPGTKDVNHHNVVTDWRAPQKLVHEL
ncbi:right-handed parallel beta-helix repeat-containing protein [Crateriforma conspicua]|uniref:Right handed beta helix domain-containing protein n=1 Tax=Crateriforma conspicua TaxID=2527996 RepID=A0A5C5Y3T8_9PLAN|nr:right-handed parallel beta-helix repeat-containing protein [Crateriforma conspicua]TWT68935.1 hypothetical protein Pan14r_12190 [Crateriforma conspicua]